MPHSPVSRSFHTHGLIGIDLQHAAARRDELVRQSRTVTQVRAGLRQRVGSLIIAAGMHLVGEDRPVPASTRLAS